MEFEISKLAIVSIASILTTYFGWLSVVRKDRIEKIQRELFSTYRQFSHLYECENHLLKRLEDLNVGKAQTIKVEVRKMVVGDSNQKIVLTSDAVKKRIAELDC